MLGKFKLEIRTELQKHCLIAMDYTRRLQPQVHKYTKACGFNSSVSENRLLTFRVEKFLNGQVITETFDHGDVDILAHGLSVSVDILA